MKAPVNFSLMVCNHKIKTGPFPGDYVYTLRDDDDDNKTIWVYPEREGASNVILMEFNWEKQFYVVKIATRGQGENFHEIIGPIPFPNTITFQSFDRFNIWLIGKLEDFHHLFKYK